MKLCSSHSLSPSALESWLSLALANGRTAFLASSCQAFPSDTKPVTNSICVMGSTLLSAASVHPRARARRPGSSGSSRSSLSPRWMRMAPDSNRDRSASL